MNIILKNLTASDRGPHSRLMRVYYVVHMKRAVRVRHDISAARWAFTLLVQILDAVCSIGGNVSHCVILVRWGCWQEERNSLSRQHSVAQVRRLLAHMIGQFFFEAAGTHVC